MPSSKNKAARSALDTLFDARTAPVGAQYSKRSKITKQEDHLGLIGPTTSNLAHAIDVFSNPAARTGYGTSSLENYAEYPLMRFSLNFWAIISFFESSWIARRIVCAPAEDIVKTWPKITSDIDPEDLTRIDRAVRRTNTRSKVREAIEKARLFGGAGALIAIKKQDKELDQPLELDSVGIHDYAGLITFDRWSGISPTGDVCDDLNRPLDFGHSEFYEVKVKGGDSFKVHNSRILRFSGPRMPEPENSAYQDWGISVLAPVIQTIQGYDTLTSNALSLSFRANILGMKAPDLAGMMSGLSMNQAAAQKFEQRMQRFNEMLSNQSLALLEKDGELSQTQYSFAGLSDMMQMWQLAISGAAKMPVTRLWGRTYSGLGQAGDGDEKIYEETISTESDVTLRPALEKLYPVLCMSELGEVPDDLDLLFPSIRVLDDKEKAELAKTVVDTAVVALNAGGISLRTFAKELKQSSTRTEIFTNITDEDIEKLSDKVQAEGEMGEGLFGAEGGGLNPASSPAKALTEENKAGKVNGQPGEADEPQGHQAPPNGSVEEGSEGTSKAKDAGSKYATTRAELVWLDACDNEALTLPKALRGTEQGEIELHKRVVRNLSFYAEQAHVDPAKCMAYARSRGFAQDADLRKGVTKCQWCAADLDGDDVNGSVVCPSCSDAYRRGRANDVKPWSAAKLATVEALRSAGFRITSDSNYAYIVWFGTEAPGARKPDLDLRATVSGNGQYEMGVWVRGAYVTTERGFKPEHVQQQVLKYVQRAQGKARTRAEDTKMTPELIWLEACDNEAETLPKALRGTDEGVALLYRRAFDNLYIYADQYGVDPAKCKAYARSRGFVGDTGQARDADGPAVETKTIHGLPVVIEQKRGQWRTGQGWRVRMAYDYGYFDGIPGADGDSLDICIGPDPASTWVYIFDQKHLPPRRGFDEHKCFVGYSSMDDAIKAFNAGHDRACSIYMDVTPMQVDDFKKWLKKHDMSKPAGTVKP